MPKQAEIRPGMPAPAIGPGTAENVVGTASSSRPVRYCRSSALNDVESKDIALDCTDLESRPPAGEDRQPGGRREALEVADVEA